MPNGEGPAGEIQPAFFASAHGGYRLRAVRVWLCVALVGIAACGGSTPTSPASAPDVVQLGPQVLEIEQQPSAPFCGVPAGTAATLLVTRVTLAWSGSEWAATPTSAASGDVALHLRPAGTGSGARVPVSGAISGTAIHVPELFVGFPAYTARITFAAGGQTTLTGTAVAAGNPFPSSEIDGTGTGSASVTDGAAITCPGTSFAWRLYPSGA